MVKGSIASMKKELEKPEIPKARNSVKIKVTFMIPEELMVSLEKNVMKAKNMFTPKQRGKINKSLFAEFAIRSALSDFAANGKDSQIYRNTESHITGISE